MLATRISCVRRCGKSGQTLRRDSPKSSTDQLNMQPQAAHSQTDCQSLRLPESCSWVNTRLLSGGPDGPKTRSVNGLVSRRRPVRRCRRTPSLPVGPPPTPSTPPYIRDRRRLGGAARRESGTAEDGAAEYGAEPVMKRGAAVVVAA